MTGLVISLLGALVIWAAIYWRRGVVADHRRARTQRHYQPTHVRILEGDQ
jgi:hypothetical protein